MWRKIFSQWSMIIVLVISGFQPRLWLSASKYQLPRDCGRASSISYQNEADWGRADARSVPSFVSLIIESATNSTKEYCDGTILSERLVLTSAKCVNRLHFSGKIISVVQPQIVTVTSAKDVVEYSTLSAVICSSTRHHDLHSHASHDIAVIQLATPLTFSDTTQPACLPGGSEYLWPTDALCAIGSLEITQYLDEVEEKSSVDIETNIDITLVPVAERDCPDKRFHPSIACFDRQIDRQTSIEYQEELCLKHQGGPIMGGIKPGGKHTVYGVISQPTNASCSRASRSPVQAANLIHLRREILELVEECSFGLT